MGTTVKDRILEALEQLPSSATIEDAMERLYFMAKVERGTRDVELGRVMEHAEVKTRFGR